MARSPRRCCRCRRSGPVNELRETPGLGRVPLGEHERLVRASSVSARHPDKDQVDCCATRYRQKWRKNSIGDGGPPFKEVAESAMLRAQPAHTTGASEPRCVRQKQR